MSETSSKKKIKVLLTSVDAGGGHLELRDNFLRTLQKDEYLEVSPYHSPTKVFDTPYKLMMKYYPKAWDYIVNSEGTFLTDFIAKRMSSLFEGRHLKKVIKKVQPDVVLCTHFSQAISAHQLKNKKLWNFKIVSGVYDYGNQKYEMHLHTPAEFYVVRDEESKEYAEKYFQENRILVFGTSVNEAFYEVARLSRERVIERFRDFFNRNITNKNYDEKRKNVLFLGGSGWARKSLGLIKKINAEGKWNVFVSCGRDFELVRDLEKMKNVFAFGFVSKNDLATIEAYVDAVILCSIAPATMHELMEINRSPLFLHNFIKPQEEPHVDLIERWQVGKYQPEDEQMISLIEEYFSVPQNFQFMLDNARRIRDLENKKSVENPEIIKKVFDQA